MPEFIELSQGAVNVSAILWIENFNSYIMVGVEGRREPIKAGGEDMRRVMECVKRNLYRGEKVEPHAEYRDLHFDDGEHAGVRVVVGTSIIEVQRKRKRQLFDIINYQPLKITEAA